MQVHINRDGQNYGPYSLDEVRQYLASGNLVDTDLAWFEGAANWMPLSQVPGVAPARPAAPAAAPAPASRPAAAAPAAAAVAAPAALGAVTYAGFWRRVVAYVVDGLLVGVVMTLLIFLFAAGAIGGIAAGSPEAAAAAVGLIGLINIGSIIAMWLYFALMESSARQGTLGKMAVGLVVTDLEGRRIGFGRATGRFFGKILSGLLFAIGFLMAGFTERKQGLHDMLASTLVVNKDPADTRVPWWGWLVIVLFFVLPLLLSVISMLGAIAIPAYSDYTARAQVASALSGAGDARVALSEYALSNQRLPDSLDQIGIAPVVQGASLALEDGMLVLTITAPGTAADGGTLALEPYQAADGSIVWRCGNAQPPAGATDVAPGDAYASTSLGSALLPASCR